MRVGILLFLSLVLLTANLAAAEKTKKADARKHFRTGLELVEGEDFDGAVVEFEKSQSLHETKGVLFNLAFAYKAVHRYSDSIATFEKLLSKYSKKMKKTMRREAEDQLKKLQGIVARLQIKVDQPGASITVDGTNTLTSPQQEPLIVGPGAHKIVVSLDGFETQTLTVSTVSGEESTVVIAMLPVQRNDTTVEDTVSVPMVDTSKKTLSPLTWVGISGTVLTGAGAAVFWGLWSGAKDDRDAAGRDIESTPEGSTPSDATVKAFDDASDKAGAFGNVAIGLSVAAGVFLVGTTISLIVDLKKSDSEANDSALIFAPGFVQVEF